MRLPPLVLAAAVFLSTAAAADNYSWTDAKGTVHFSSKPPAKKTRQGVRVHKSLPVSTFEFKPAAEEDAAAASKPGAAASGAPAAAAAAAAPATAYRAAPGVEFYATASCGYCAQAREFLRANRIKYTEYDVEHDRAAYERFKNLHGYGVPLAVIGGATISGYSPERYAQALGIR